jgi:helix-turn-helix protein
VVIDLPVGEQFRLARTARGESINAVARRTGIRIEWLQAIDEGRFGDLPAGIYARASVRTYAAALELDVHNILMRCSPLLPLAEDPIQAMRRLNGIGAAPPSQPEQPIDRGPFTLPEWRIIVASIIDASTMAVALLVLVTCLVAIGLPVTSLHRAAAAPLFAVMLLVAVLYFVVFGGIVGQTVGEYITGSRTSHPVKLNLHAVAARTRAAALRDSYFVERLGEWIGRSITGNWHGPLANFHKVGRGL